MQTTHKVDFFSVSNHFRCSYVMSATIQTKERPLERERERERESICVCVSKWESDMHVVFPTLVSTKVYVF